MPYEFNNVVQSYFYCITDLCPNNSLPLMENGRPKQCMGILQSECGSSGDYKCKGTGDSKYCCPARVNNNGMSTL